MGRLLQLIIMMAAIAGYTGSALASPTIDSLNVQGYLKKANGTQVTDGTYTLAFGVFQNGVNIWGKSYSVSVTNGLFSRALSGVGGDLSGLPGATGINTNFSATGTNVTLNSALLVAGGSGAVAVRVYAVTPIDSTNPQFDLTLAAVPTAMVCENAKGVVSGSVTVAGLAVGAKTTISAGSGDVGKLALLDAAGKFDVSTIPTLDGATMISGSVGVGNGGTGSANGSITGTGSVIYESAAGSTTSIGNNTSTSSLALRSGTGGIAASVTGTSGDVALSAGTTSGNVSLVAGSAGTVTVGSSSTGTSIFGNTGAGSATVVRSGTGGVSVAVNGTTGSITMVPGSTSGSITAGTSSTGAAVFGNTGAGSVSTLQAGSQAVVTSAGTTSSAVNITASGTGGGITLAPEATGDLVAGGGSTSGAVTVGNASTGAAIFGNTGAASTSNFRAGSGGATLTSSGTTSTAVNITATGTAGGITLAPNATGATTISGGTGLTVSPSAAASGSPSLLSVTGAADSGLTASTEKNDILFNLARTMTFATGALATQRSVYVQAPTLAFAGASVVTRANTVAISGPPVAGANATLTNAASFVVESGKSGFGATSPTALVHMGAGTATAGTAPMKFTSGTNLTTAEAGAVEYDGSVLTATMDTTHGRGQVPVEQYFRLSADGAAIGPGIGNFFAGTSNISLASGASYEIEIYAYFLKTTAGTVTWTFTNTAAPTAMNVAMEMSPAAGVVATAAAGLGANLVKSVSATPTLITPSLTTAVNHYAHFKIYLVNNTGTSLTLRATEGAGTITPLLGSYWKARRLPANSTGTLQ